MDFYIVLSNIGTLFLLMIVGYLSGKKNIVNKNSTSDLSELLVNVTLPANIFVAMLQPYNPLLLTDSFIIAGITFVFLITCAFASYHLTKIAGINNTDRGVWIVASTFSNNAFMGYPIVYSIFGEDGLFIASMMGIAYSLLFFTLGAKMMCAGTEENDKLDIKKLLFSNITIATYIGFFFFITQIQLPEIIVNMFSLLGSITTPLAMFIIGLIISKSSNLKEMFDDPKLFILSSVRLLIMPLIIIVIMNILPFRSDSLVPSIMVIITAMPVASTTTMLAEKYKGNTMLSAKIILITNLMCLITIPIICMLI